MKKILFFINTLSGGGAEKVLVDLVRILPKSLYEVTIISLYGGINEERIPPSVHYRCIINTSNPVIRKWLVSFFCKIVPYKTFAKVYLSGEYDIKIAYLNGFPTRVLASDQDRIARKITFVHSDFSRYYGMDGVYKSREECLQEYRSFDSVCFVAESAKDGFFNAIGVLDNAHVVHNVIDTEAVREMSLLPIEEKYNTSGLKIISMGRLVEVKAFERLINISSYLKRFKKDHEIWILGEGSLREKLELLIKQKGVEDTVKLLGFKSNPYPYVSKADLYICSSLYEGYSTAVVEALSLGVPVLTTQCSGMNEILHNGEFGTIVSNDEEDLKTELSRIADDNKVLLQYREKANAGKLCYTPENSIREYYSLLSQ